MSFALAIPLLSKAIDKLFPDPAARDAAKLRLLELEQQGELAELDAEVRLALAQTEISKEEARSGSLWVAGARPGIIWICGVALAWSYILHPMIQWAGFLAGYDLSSAPRIDIGALLPLITALLGLGTLRSFDKVKGVETRQVN